MTATILAEATLPQLPSASGVEIVGTTAWIVSDDAPFLYSLDAATLQPTGRVELFASSEFAAGRIPKLTKPDLEALTAVPEPAGGTALLLCGSGSLPNREVGYYVRLAAGAAPTAARVNLAPLYAQLRHRLPAGSQLNIEAIAATPTELLLLQRAVGTGTAVLFGLPLAPTLAHLRSPTLPLPPLTRAEPFRLPLLEGRPAGFSGATFAQGALLVTASVEDTTDAILDGQVLGSFVGVIELDTYQARFARVAWPDGRFYTGKVEGLALRRSLSPTEAELLLVTDDDQGGSTSLITQLNTAPD